MTVALLTLTGLLGLFAAPVGLVDAGPVILIPTLTFAILRLVAAYWLWHRRLWAAILGLVVTLLDTLLALPVVIDAPRVLLSALATIGVITGVALLALLSTILLRRM